LKKYNNRPILFHLSPGEQENKRKATMEKLALPNKLYHLKLLEREMEYFIFDNQGRKKYPIPENNKFVEKLKQQFNMEPSGLKQKLDLSLYINSKKDL